MTISVVVPSFNQGRYLEQCLNSIIKQSRSPDEILVLDGGSTDESSRILSRYTRHLTFWRSHADRGQAAAVNEGISRAQGQWIAWVNSDDLLMPDALLSIEKIARKGRCSFIYGGSIWSNSDLTCMSIYPPARKVTLDDFADGASPLCQPATVFKRCSWQKIGKLNEELHFALDYDFFVRALKAGESLRRSNEYIAVNRVHEQTKTQSGYLVKELEEVAAWHFGAGTRRYPLNALQKYGLRILRKYPLWFLIGCQIASRKRRASCIPGYPVRETSEMFRSARMAAGI
jgi:glycosyltransferase involved in cell wall biosynthesis